MALPAEKVSELRQLVHSRVSQLGIQEQIRGCLADTLTQDGRRNLDEGALLQALEERGVVDQVMQSLNLGDGGHVMGEGGRVMGEGKEVAPPTGQFEGRSRETPQKAPLGSNRRYLFLQTLGGKAFLEHLQDSEDSCQATFTLHVHFRGQRFHSRAVPCSCEPDFQEGFLLELTKGRKEGRMISYSDALSIADPIQLVLTRTSVQGEVDLVGTHHLEWRGILADSMGRISMSVEISGVGSEAQIPAGLLEFRLEILPKSSDVIHGDVLSAQLGLEKQRSAERERLFLVYAKQWWREFLQIRPSHSQRLVKIFAQDERGMNRPVCVYVHPLRAGRLLDSPRHAARFASLVPFERASSVGSGGCSEVWSSLHTMLSQRKGNCEDHATLLCSLLLGYGLDAYVCVGTKARGLAHAWVMTVSHEGSVIFWESLTGQRFLHPEFDPTTQAGSIPPSPSHPYHTIGCVFNHQAFYANAQPSDAVTTCRFDLHNGSLWKAMSPEAIRSVAQGPVLPPLLSSRVDPVLSANEMERELRRLVVQYRDDLGLSTVWDEDLCYLLSPALSAYELERCVGVSAGNEEFQEAVRNAVPEGHTFKGFPIQLLHRNPQRAFSTCLKSPVCVGILGCKGDHVRLAVRVRVCPFPEDICATWLMLAVKYRSVL